MNPDNRPKALDNPLVPRLMRVLSRANVWVYQKTGGRLAGKWRGGAAFPWGLPILLLTTVGKKTGIRRTAPLLFIEDGDALVVVASQGGMPSAPLWFNNLVANPEVEIQLGSRVEPRRARVAMPEEREALWPRLVAHYADFAAYQAWKKDTIPVVFLERSSAG